MHIFCDLVSIDFDKFILKCMKDGNLKYIEDIIKTDL